MRDGWRETTLSEIAEIEMGQSPPGASYNMERDGLPFLQGSAEFGSRFPRPERWCSAPRKVAEPGDLLMSVRAPVGDVNFADQRLAIGRGLARIRGRAGVARTDFVALVVEALAPEMRRRSGGTMFESINGRSLSSQQVLLPPVAEQLRIVDLLGALDRAIESAYRQRDTTASALRLHLRQAVAISTDQHRRLGDVADMGSGPSWGAVDEIKGRAPDATPVVGITATPAGSTWIDASRARFVRGLSASTRRLTVDSLLLIRTNGNRERVGNIYRVPQGAVGSAYSAFQIGLFPREPADSAWLHWCLASPDVQEAISAAASGSTGLSNIAVTWLKNLELPWPDRTVRTRLVAQAESLERARDAAEAVADRLRPLRRAVLEGLLSGDHEVPASYDRFLGVAE